MEFAAGLAGRLLDEGSSNDADRLAHGFRLCLARPPAEQELDLLVPFVEKQRSWFQEHPEDAKKLVAAAGAVQQTSDDIPSAELAAWIATARVLLNLDEFITRN